MITAQFRQKVVKNFKICYFTATFFLNFPKSSLARKICINYLFIVLFLDISYR